MNAYNFDLVGTGRYQERFGLDFEDFRVGQRFVHRPGVTVTQQDNLDEALDTTNSAMLHYDAHYAGQTTWGKPLMVSTITLQRAIGMAATTFGRKRCIPAFHEIAMTAPVFGGDTLYADSEVLGIDATDHPDGGVLKVKTNVQRADGKQVASLTYDIEIYRRGRFPGDNPEARPADDPRFLAYREQADGSLIEQYGLFFEDAQAGETFVHYPRRTFTREEAVEHARRSFDFGRVVANLGWTDIQLPVPVFEGDTLEAESTIVEKRESKSRPNEGILTVDTRAYNQDRELVLSYRRRLLVYRRDAETPYARAGY